MITGAVTRSIARPPSDGERSAIGAAGEKAEAAATSNMITLQHRMLNVSEIRRNFPFRQRGAWSRKHGICCKLGVVGDIVSVE